MVGRDGKCGADWVSRCAIDPFLGVVWVVDYQRHGGDDDRTSIDGPVLAVGAVALTLGTPSAHEGFALRSIRRAIGLALNHGVVRVVSHVSIPVSASTLPDGARPRSA